MRRLPLSTPTSIHSHDANRLLSCGQLRIEVEGDPQVTLVKRIAAYAWTSPNTLIGLVLGLVVLPFGGKVRIVRGVVEFAAGIPLRMPFDAICFGHAIIGVSEAKLDAVRDHEHVHVRQYEAWGPFFLAAYAASSAWQLLRGRRMYYDNYFERQARQA